MKRLWLLALLLFATTAQADNVDKLSWNPTLKVFQAQTHASGTKNSLSSQTGSVSSTFTFNGSGSTSSAVTMTYVRQGDWVTLYFPTSTTPNTGTSSTLFTANTAVDTFARPSSLAQYFVVPQMKNNGSIAASPGQAKMSTAGILSFQLDGAGTAFANGAAAGPNQPFSFTYYVGTGS